MNIETANRLLAYRKRFGYSQEQLAEKLGISRQAISKWERAEASPDTDNLIELAKLYGVSLDALVMGDPDLTAADAEKKDAANDEAETSSAPESRESSPKKEKNRDREDDDEDDDEDEDEDDHDHDITIRLSGGREVYFPTGVMATIAFFVLGLVLDAWHPGWMVFFFIPIVGSISDCIRTRSLKPFAYPMLCTVVFLVIGFYAPSGWAWGWLVFLTIPIWHPFTELWEHTTAREDEEHKTK